LTDNNYISNNYTDYPFQKPTQMHHLLYKKGKV